jgi:hypothetical protein
MVQEFEVFMDTLDTPLRPPMTVTIQSKEFHHESCEFFICKVYSQRGFSQSFVLQT